MAAFDIFLLRTARRLKEAGALMTDRRTAATGFTAGVDPIAAPAAYADARRADELVLALARAIAREDAARDHRAGLEAGKGKCASRRSAG